jgi:hypothetical protein
MSKRHLLVSALVAAICAAILVLFTDIERSARRWISCDLGLASGPADPACRRRR